MDTRSLLESEWAEPQKGFEEWRVPPLCLRSVWELAITQHTFVSTHKSLGAVHVLLGIAESNIVGLT